MKTLREYLNEATEVSIEVNKDFSSNSEKTIFIGQAHKNNFSVSFGKNKYADTVTLVGDKQKVIKFLKKYGYSEEEMTIKK